MLLGYIMEKLFLFEILHKTRCMYKTKSKQKLSTTHSF